MKFSKEDKKEFFKRKEILESAKLKLKDEFVGLNDIIDEVIDLIEPWYLFPNGQMRPTIINLWGMTGVGKTSLIKRLFEHIDLTDSLYKFDVGDYASQNNSKLSYAFSEELKNRENHQIGIIFDEFQLGRTIDETGSELEKSGLRAMWDLLDSGKISILQSSYYGSKVYQLTMKLEDCVNNGSVKAKNGKINAGKKYHEKYFKEEEGEEDVVMKGDDKPKAPKIPEDLFVPEDFHWYIQSIWDTRFITERELKEYLKTMDESESIQFLNDTMQKAFKPVEFDYSSSCVFVIGNIDEAYRMTKNFDPDSDADRFHKHSLKITLPQIKGALQRRFRSEQIARLGNNHVIYPAFSSKVYKELISLELDKVKGKVKEKFDIDIKFDKSIDTILYKEGVFPTQGARPVFTTLTSLIESYIGKIIKEILESGKDVSSVLWKFSRGKHKVNFFDNKKNNLFVKTFSVRLKIESLRQSVGDEMQAHVAIHEAGHAVAAIYGANILPDEILSRTANVSEGYCSIDMPSINTKELYVKDIIISLAGYVAEKMVFGEDNLGAGTGGDFERASGVALRMAKTFGMLDDVPMFYGHKDVNTNTQWSSENIDEIEKLARNLVRDCEKECKKILEENKYLLLKIGEYLSTHSRMDSKKILKFVNEFGNDVEFKDRKTYHSFKQKIEEGLSKEKSFEPVRSVSNLKKVTLEGEDLSNVMESKKKEDE